MVHQLLYKRYIQEDFGKKKKKKKGGLGFKKAGKSINKSVIKPTNNHVIKPINKTVIKPIEKEVIKPINKAVIKPLVAHVFKPVAKFFKDPFDIQAEREKKKKELQRKLQAYKDALQADFDNKKNQRIQTLDNETALKLISQNDLDYANAVLKQNDSILKKELLSSDLDNSNISTKKLQIDVLNDFMYSNH
jgi:hypothetical protein